MNKKQKRQTSTAAALEEGKRLALPALLRRIVLTPWLVPLLVFVGFFVLNLDISGPAVLSDEIGYLSKAATIAGDPVHFASSWFGGYSLLIAPAFLLTHDPYGVWLGVLAINAALWAVAAILLRSLLRRLFPSASPLRIQLVTFGSLLYPGWIAMSGYAMATSGFVPVLLASLLALERSRYRSRRWLLISGLLAGYLCWIHPMGYLFVAALALIVSVRAVVKRHPYSLLPLAPAVMMVLLYRLAAMPFFARTMGSSVSSSTHYGDQYGSQLGRTVHSLLLLHTWENAAVLCAGLLCSVVVATFGVAVYAAVPVASRLRHRSQWRRLVTSPAQSTVLVALLALAGTVAFTAFVNAKGTNLRPDQWIYGRYSDMFLLPIIGIGLMQPWRLKWAAMLAAFVAASGLLLAWFVPTTTKYPYLNKLDIVSFWPMHLTSLVHHNYFWLWGLLGAAGVLIAGFAGTIQRRPWLITALPLIAAVFVANNLFHRSLIQHYSQPSQQIYSLVTEQPAGTCVGFSPGTDTSERYALYTFYFHTYALQRMSLQDWQQQCKDRGVYLTYGADQALPGLATAAIDPQHGLLALTRHP